MLVSLRKWLTISLSLSLFVLAVVLIPAFALAQEANLASVGGAAGFDTGTDLFTIIGSIINVLLGLLGIFFLILVIYSGYLWGTAGGSDDQIKKAKKTLINGVVGLIIILASYAIATFVINALTNSGLGSRGAVGSNGFVGIEPLSGSLGSGAIHDHYPRRGQSDVPRNVNITVTFRSPMDLASFIDGYDTNGTALDLTDDIAATNLKTDNVRIYPTAEGDDAAFSSEDVTVNFTEDLQTFVFDVPILGSPSETTNYSVFLDDSILTADGVASLNVGGYEWTFETGTTIDVTPPTVRSVIPSAGGVFDRNIAVQINFDEPIDPTSATGSTALGFENIQAFSPLLVSGNYVISNGYQTITFVTDERCGVNSCGADMFCLPGASDIDVTVYAPAPGIDPPQVDIFPYQGVVDMAANALDGDGDGIAGDNYAWSFSTTGEINQSTPELFTITPNILEGNVLLDQPIELVFSCAESTRAPGACNAILMSSEVNSTNITVNPSPEHELWYRFNVDYLPEESDSPSETRITIPHGVFLESTDVQNYSYDIAAFEGLKNQYQNCFAPAVGPSADGLRCEGSPHCCNGIPSLTACDL
ncbi:MAG: hypothetical protein O3B64_03270 [bacterium]|nr:hypothetical protein [bacterium]